MSEGKEKEHPPLEMESRILNEPNYIAKLKKKRGGIVATLRKIMRTSIFILFVAFYIQTILSEQSPSDLVLKRSMMNRFDKDGVVTLDDVDSIPMFWNYMNHTFLPAFLFVEVGNKRGKQFGKFFQEGLMDSSLVDDFGTRIIGERVLLRNFRVVRDMNCDALRTEDFSKRYNCYGPWTPDTNEIQMYGKSGKAFQSADIPEVAAASNVTSTSFPKVTGKLGIYDGAGYLQTFGGTIPDAADILDEILYQQYVDLATRALMIEFNVWTPNEKSMGVARILFEVTETGHWENTFTLDVIQERYLDLVFDTKMIIELFLILFLFYYLAEELTEFVSNRHDYVRDGWNFLDWANLILLVVFVVKRFQCYSIATNIMDNVAGSEKYTDMSLAADYIKQIRDINSLNMVLVAGKILKYIAGIPFTETATWILSSSWKFFFSFAVVFFAIFNGFVIAFYTGFGDKFPLLRDYRRSSLYLSRSFVGDINLSVFDPPFDVRVYLLFVYAIIQNLVLLNLFFGIMVAALGEVGMKMKEDDSEGPLEIIGRWWTKLIQRRIPFEKIFEKNFPVLYYKLYASTLALRKLNAARKKEREHYKKENVTEIVEGGPGSDFSGRLKKPRKAKRRETVEASSSDSEEDLGSLSNTQIAKRQLRKLQGETIVRGPTEIQLEAVSHMCHALGKRGLVIQSVIDGEIGTISELCGGLRCALEIINQRVRDLETQQMNFLETA